MDSVDECFKKSCGKKVLQTVCFCIVLGIFCMVFFQKVMAKNAEEKHAAPQTEKLKRADYRLRVTDWQRMAR